MSDATKLEQIEFRVRKTICPTYSSDGKSTVEGRISKDDFETLLQLIADVREDEREHCAMLHESVNPASDIERHHGDPGAGAMAAVIEYRDLIRSRP